MNETVYPICGPDLSSGGHFVQILTFWVVQMKEYSKAKSLKRSLHLGRETT